MAAEEACRPASVADLPQLAVLAAEAIEERRSHRGGDLWARTAGRTEPLEAGLARELADLLHRVVVGTLDDVVVGYGVAKVEELRDGTRLGVLTDLYTDPRGREVGVGEAMMSALVAWCDEQACIGVDALALPGDRATKNFFESFGLVARAIIVHRALR